MEQTARVYRGLLRNVVLCVAFALVTVFSAFGALVSRPSVGAMVAFGLFALLTLYICVRVAVMKAVATPNGMTLHGPLLTVTVPWERVSQVVGDDTETDFHLIPVRGGGARGCAAQDGNQRSSCLVQRDEPAVAG